MAAVTHLLADVTAPGHGGGAERTEGDVAGRDMSLGSCSVPTLLPYLGGERGAAGATANQSGDAKDVRMRITAQAPSSAASPPPSTGAKG